MYTLYALCIKNGFDKCIFVQFKFWEKFKFIFKFGCFRENLNFKLHHKNALKTD